MEGVMEYIFFIHDRYVQGLQINCLTRSGTISNNFMVHDYQTGEVGSPPVV